VVERRERWKTVCARGASLAAVHGRSSSSLGASMQCLRLVLLLLFELALLSGCQSRESTVVRSVPDPLTGQSVEWRVSTVGDVEVLTPTADPSAVLFYVKGKPVALTFTVADHRVTYVLDGKSVSVATVKSSARTGKPLSIRYGQSDWLVIDENFVGQLDTRGRGRNRSMGGREVAASHSIWRRQRSPLHGGYASSVQCDPRQIRLDLRRIGLDGFHR